MDHPTKRSFNFVNLNHPDELKDEETQLRIRRLAMTEVGKTRRKPKTERRRNEMVLIPRGPTERYLPVEGFGAEGFDPFGQFPIELDDSSRALVANST
jgi:hypothetical protein